jgi:hypothetical protein
VRDQQVGEPLPDMAEHPVGPGAAVVASRADQDMTQAADPAVVGQDQLDDVGLLAGPGRNRMMCT